VRVVSTEVDSVSWEERVRRVEMRVDRSVAVLVGLKEGRGGEGMNHFGDFGRLLRGIGVVFGGLPFW
jgi:hypothetical protein